MQRVVLLLLCLVTTVGAQSAPEEPEFAPEQTPEDLPPHPTPAPPTPAPLSPAPPTDAPLTPAPLSPAPPTDAPLTPAPLSPAPLTAAPPTPAPTAPETEFVWCGNNAACRAYGDSAAVCTQGGLCSCSDGFAPSDGGVGLCFSGGVPPNATQTFVASLRWPLGVYEELARAPEARDRLAAIVSAALGVPSLGEVIFRPGSVVAALAFKESYHNMSHMRDAGDSVQALVLSDEKLFTILGNFPPSVLIAEPGSGVCPTLDGLSVPVADSGQCVLVKCNEGFHVTSMGCFQSSSVSPLVIAAAICAASGVIVIFSCFLVGRCRKNRSDYTELQ